MLKSACSGEYSCGGKMVSTLRSAGLILILFYFVLSSTLLSQDVPFEWEKVSRGDFRMMPDPPDSDATVLIIGDYGESSINDDLEMVFKRQTRLKILSTAGYDWATRSVTILDKEGAERIGNVEGATYLLNPDSTIARKSMEDRAIFEENVDGRHKRIKFTLPALAPGCVIEFRYTIVAKSLGNIQDWTFQESEPVHWSEYRVRVPVRIAYAGVTIGYEPFFLNEVTEAHQRFQGTAASFLGEELVRCSQNRWAVRDAPALRAD